MAGPSASDLPEREEDPPAKVARGPRASDLPDRTAGSEPVAVAGVAAAPTANDLRALRESEDAPPAGYRGPGSGVRPRRRGV